MRMVAVVLVLVHMLLGGNARGDSSTPFVDTLQTLGQVGVGRGYVLADVDDNGVDYLVMVRTDQMEWRMIIATAEKGVVAADVVGRYALIRAQLTSKATTPGSTLGMRLKLLEVARYKPPTTRPG